ncbi:hypothetical protein J1N35_026223 [Gossypium stocksii]|uniref:Pentacotripeptide-repeat region of PRORP domain-containing protein n=1 Tax=Gossypium stocksii TaxID=47602 RepID=A0A9D3V8C5_9ROSI|nr:hypothetical protein J1N35_026223 [Gossypium stocksii]
MKFFYGDHALRLDLIAKTKEIVAAKDYLMTFSPMAKNEFTYCSLLNAYCKNLMKDEALALFKLMDELKLIHSDLPLNDLMQLYLKLGQFEKVLEIIDELNRRNIPRSNYTYGFLL